MGTFLVTGGGGPGIGSACCRALAADGHNIWVADIDEEAARGVAEDLGAQGFALRVDVSDPQSITTGIEHALAASVRIDGLVNSAGITVEALAGDWSVEEFEHLLHVNLRGAWLCTRAVLPSMLDNGGGSIVNVASVHAHKAEPRYGIYAASKAALVALTRAIAAEYGPRGVRCNSVSPGWVVRDEADPDLKQKAAVAARMHQMLPLTISPRDVGAAVAFLASDAARAITGVDLPVDAGRTAMLRQLVEGELS